LPQYGRSNKRRWGVALHFAACCWTGGRRGPAQIRSSRRRCSRWTALGIGSMLTSRRGRLRPAGDLLSKEGPR
jgi:hypothetical protein